VLMTFIFFAFIKFYLCGLQELLGLTKMSDAQRKLYTYQLPSDIEVNVFNHFRSLHDSDHT